MCWAVCHIQVCKACVYFDSEGGFVVQLLDYPPLLCLSYLSPSSISAATLCAWALTFVAAELGLAAGMRTCNSVGKRVGCCGLHDTSH